MVYYCLGNVGYGPNANPTDWNISLARLELTCIGNKVVGIDWTGIPGCLSSNSRRNNYQPIVYEPNTSEAVNLLKAMGLTDRIELGKWLELYNQYWMEEETTEAETTEGGTGNE